MKITASKRFSLPFLFCSLFLVLFALLLLSGCHSSAGEKTNQEADAGSPTPLPLLSKPLSRSDFLLDTIITITLYDRGNDALLEECFALCQKYDALFNRTEATSDIGRLNQAEEFPVLVSPETAELLSLALSYSECSEGAFDLTVAPLTSLWDFTSLQPVKPSDSAIQQALKHIGYQTVRLNGCAVTLDDPKAAIDLGGIAKGYIADKLKEHLLSRGVESAVISLGGNVLCVGGKSSASSASASPPAVSGFRIGIQKPFEDNSKTIAALEIRDCSVVSSGVYERCFWQDGQFYHHILNPKTGYPYDNGLIAVTIISPKSADGDALSTVCFALGLKDGMALIDSLPDTYAIFITEDEELHYSDGFLEELTVLSKTQSAFRPVLVSSQPHTDTIPAGTGSDDPVLKSGRQAAKSHLDPRSYESHVRQTAVPYSSHRKDTHTQSLPASSLHNTPGTAPVPDRPSESLYRR